MLKHPLHYEKDEIGKIMFKPLKFEIKEFDSDKVLRTITGEIIDFSYAVNPSYKPPSITIKTIGGEVKDYNIFEVNRFY